MDAKSDTKEEIVSMLHLVRTGKDLDYIYVHHATIGNLAKD